MITYSAKKNKITAWLLMFIFLVTPFTSIYSAELNSNNFIINEYDFDTGDNMNSTNFSVSGSATQGQKGLFSTNSLPLVPGVITSCGKITTAGTYTLGANLTGVSGTCFSVQVNDVIIEGDGYAVTAANSNSSYAITATSSSVAGSGYGTTTIQNIVFSGFGGGVNASGNNAVSGNTNGGNGGKLLIASSTMGAILTSSGLGSGTGSAGAGGSVVLNNSTAGNITNSGSSGSITISGSDVNLSNNIYTTSGTFSLSYSGALTTTNTTLSSLSNFIIQGTNYGSYVGGAFPIIPSTITSCGNLYFAGTYTLGSNVVGNCNILGTGVIIDGNGNTLTGNVTANNKGVTLSNITVTGAVSTTGASPGALVVNNASNLTGTINVTGTISGDGSSSLVNTTINAGGSVATSSVSFVGDVLNNGTINSGNAVVGKTTNNSIINTTGTFSFNASSTNSGTVNGNAILSASSTSSGTITGNATFNAYTAVDGTVSFGGTTAFAGTGYVNGNVYDSTGTNTIDTWVFNASSTNIGITKGNATFNDTSINTSSGRVQGNAIFNGTSRNLGIVTGIADVYSPVVRPLGGTVTGQVVYHNYAGLYFHDSVSGSGVLGKWNDINNWWVDVNATVRAPIIPTEGDDTIILSGTISTTTATARVRTVTFQNSTINGISITVTSTARDSALFNATSTNNGTIVGNATFAGTASTNNGTVTGYITRQYSTGIFTVVTDFTHNGVNWIVQAVNGATVDLTNATYSLITNIFEALSNAIFIFNNAIGGSTPTLTITTPTSGTNIKWKPVVSWGTNTLCQYKIDGGSYASVSCANNGSDVPRPSAGAHTIFFRSTDTIGNSKEKSISFTYDNTQPVDTDCTSALDEATRPYYYLTSNVGNCSVTASTTLRGDNNGGGSYYTVGNITGSSTALSLQNITGTGSVSGFTNLTVASSTIAGTVTVKGTLYADNLSRFTHGTINSGATVYGGAFTGNITNNGTISNSTTTPITVAGNTTNNGIINNGFVFNATSTNLGTVNGNLTLNGTSYNQGIVNGNLIFNTFTADSNVVTISGNTVFRGTGTVSGSLLDNRGENISIWLFENSSTNLGFTRGTSYFSGSSVNLGTISGNAHFNDSSSNSGTITGNAYKYKAWLTSSVLGGTVGGSTTYYSYPNSVSFRNTSGDNDWNNLSNWFRFSATTTALGRMPVSGEEIVLFADTTLKSNLTNNIYIGMSTTTISGANYTLTGNIFGNGAYGGHNAYNINLERIIVTGTTTAMGGDGTPQGSGGNGGNINVQYSSTGVISVSGGDPLQNGGDAGTIYTLNTIAIEEGTSILAVGGDSVGCGFGGSGGNVTLIDTSGYIVSLEPGRSATSTIAEGGGCENPPSGSAGSRGRSAITGLYNPSLNTFKNNNNNNNPTSQSVQPSAGSRSKQIVERLIPLVIFDLHPSPLNLVPLPTFGTGKNSFSFMDKIRSFFTTPISEEMLNKFASAPTLLSSFNINTMNDLIILRKKPILIKDTKIMGLFSAYSMNQTVPLISYLEYDKTEVVVQKIQVLPGQKIIISLIPTINNSNYKAVFNNKEVFFLNNKLELTAPLRSGVYSLSSSVTPIVLRIQVVNKIQDDYSTTNERVNLMDIVYERAVTVVKSTWVFLRDKIDTIRLYFMRLF